jgi:glycosyltransferase involved in cell wall biosynthesis
VSKLLVVTHDMRPSGPARRLQLFARAMPPGEVEICLLGQASAWSRSLAEAGVPVHAIGSSGPFDLRSLWRLRERVRGAPHLWAWGPGAAWPVVLGGVWPSRLVSPLPAGRRPSLASKWLVRRCGVLVADGEAEAESLRRLGVEEGRLRVVAPGVEVAAPAQPARLPGLPDDARVMLLLGPIARTKGPREAVWVLDILTYLEDRLHLVFVGDGPDMVGVRRFVEVARREDRTHFVGVVADLAPWLARADVVLALGTGGGRMAILDTMSAGRPVVATRSADRAELLDHGRTGLFARVEDIPDLCRQIKAVLDDPTLARTLGANARAEVATRFGVAAFVGAMNV